MRGLRPFSRVSQSTTYLVRERKHEFANFKASVACKSMELSTPTRVRPSSAARPASPPPACDRRRVSNCSRRAAAPAYADSAAYRFRPYRKRRGPAVKTSSIARPPSTFLTLGAFRYTGCPPLAAQWTELSFSTGAIVDQVKSGQEAMFSSFPAVVGEAILALKRLADRLSGKCRIP